MEQHHIVRFQQMFCFLIIRHTLHEKQGALRVDNAKNSVNALRVGAVAEKEGGAPRFAVFVAHKYLVEGLKHEKLVYKVALKEAFNAHRFAVVTETFAGECVIEFEDLGERGKLNAVVTERGFFSGEELHVIWRFHFKFVGIIRHNAMGNVANDIISIQHGNSSVNHFPMLVVTANEHIIAFHQFRRKEILLASALHVHAKAL